MSTKLVNLRIDFAFKQLFETQVNMEIQLRNTHDMVKQSLSFSDRILLPQACEGR
ncbi:hypothetical protein [Bacillus paramycoides]|uniref:hypothetical protein n=1 Tax=Bacillus paramycoides TaxID=2026194 RepID=UPI003D006C55